MSFEAVKSNLCHSPVTPVPHSILVVEHAILKLLHFYQGNTCSRRWLRYDRLLAVAQGLGSADGFNELVGLGTIFTGNHGFFLGFLRWKPVKFLFNQVQLQFSKAHDLAKF